MRMEKELKRVLQWGQQVCICLLLVCTYCQWQCLNYVLWWLKGIHLTLVMLRRHKHR